MAHHSVSPTSSLAGDPRLAPLISRFVAGLPDRVAALEGSLAARDLDGLAVHAHRLKGTAGAYGFEPISEAAAHLEDLARAREALGEIRERVRLVAELCQRTRAPGTRA